MQSDPMAVQSFKLSRGFSAGVPRVAFKCFQGGLNFSQSKALHGDEF
jgi:hypothetical protein